MAETKVAIIFYSQTGTVETMARRLADSATAQGADQLGDTAALTDGYSAAFLGAAGIAVAGAALAAALLRTPKAERAQIATAEEPIAA